jgi:Cu2+-exporting ATPase
VCMFTFLLLFGRFVEAQARYQAGHSGNELHQLLPPMCTRIKALDSDEVTQVAVSKLICGDYVRVLPGATLPADGTIVTGSTSINEAALSGEFIPVTKQLGDSVSAGTVNVASSIDIVVTQLNSNSRLQQILSLVQQAHSFRPKLSQRADTVAHYFVFIVLLASASVYGIWYFIDADKAFWVTLSVLVITCPCALSLAGPTATAVATDSLRKQGILMTREDALEQVAQVDTIVFDKTGTLTTGSMALEKTIVLGEMDQALCLQLACALESQSEHPVARAFLKLFLKIRLKQHISLRCSLLTAPTTQA